MERRSGQRRKGRQRSVGAEDTDKEGTKKSNWSVNDRLQQVSLSQVRV